MPGSLTLNDIRDRAREFSAKWKGEKREEAEKQTFWNELFEVFGVTRRRYAVYEVPVSLREGKRGKVDVFWPGTLLAEHQSAGHDLTAAFEQARDYFHGIAEKDLPKPVVVSDFARFRVYSTNGGKPVEFPLSKLRENISAFNVLTGHTTPHYDEAPDVNVKAAKVMAKLHESLLTNGYSGHPLAVLMVRLMFCFFADKTGIFDRDLFRQIIELKTAEDGRDVGPLLINVFEQLNKPKEDRQRNLDPDPKAPQDRGALHEREEHPQGDRSSSHRPAASRIRKGLGRDGPAKVAEQDWRREGAGPGVRLRQFSGDRLPRTAPSGD